VNRDLSLFLFFSDFYFVFPGMPGGASVSLNFGARSSIRLYFFGLP